MKKLRFPLIILIFLCTNAHRGFSQNDNEVLPVAIKGLNSQVLAKFVQLNWSVTANEEAKSFDLERASDGGSYFKIGSKLAMNRTGDCAYEFVDASPKKNSTLSYRVKVWNKDGSAGYSVPVIERIDDEILQIRLKQNPVHSIINMEVSASQKGTATITIASLSGQKNVTQIFSIAEGTNALNIPAQSLLPGVYQAAVEMNGVRKQVRFIKEQ